MCAAAGCVTQVKSRDVLTLPVYPAPVKLTRYSHSCVRLEHEGRVLVIDPGVWSEPRALHGADAVLVTHEHADHVDVLRLRGSGVPVFAPEGASIPGLVTEPVSSGSSFTAAGFLVRAVGGSHAAVLEGQETCANLGYVVDGSVYHPGDALHVPEVPVETLLVPLQASWLKTCEAVSFVRAVRPERAFGIHDAQINERALGSLNGWIGEHGGTSYSWLVPGTEA
jgi:L-ascorbate metabolism protein UlaG (beta-lactamase superfamily)